MQKKFREYGCFGIAIGVAIALSGCGSGPAPAASQQVSQEGRPIKQTNAQGNLRIDFNSIGAIDVRNLTLAQLNDALDPQYANDPLPGAMAGLSGEASLSVASGDTTAGGNEGTTQPITGLSVTLLFDPTKPGGEQCLGFSSEALASSGDFEIEGNGIIAQLGYSWMDVFNDNSSSGLSMENNLLNLWQQTANPDGNNQNGVDFTTTNIGIVLTELTQCQGSDDTTDDDSGSSGSSGSSGTTQGPSWDLQSTNGA